MNRNARLPDVKLGSPSVCVLGGCPANSGVDGPWEHLALVVRPALSYSRAVPFAKVLSQESFVLKSLGRFGPRHPVLGAIGSRAALPVAERYFRRKQIHRSTSHFAAERRNELSARTRARRDRLSSRHQYRRVSQQRGRSYRSITRRRAANHMQQRRRAVFRSKARQQLSKRVARSSNRYYEESGHQPRADRRLAWHLRLPFVGSHWNSLPCLRNFRRACT